MLLKSCMSNEHKHLLHYNIIALRVKEKCGKTGNHGFFHIESSWLRFQSLLIMHILVEYEEKMENLS